MASAAVQHPIVAQQRREYADEEEREDDEQEDDEEEEPIEVQEAEEDVKSKEKDKEMKTEPEGEEEDEAEEEEEVKEEAEPIPDVEMKEVKHAQGDEEKQKKKQKKKPKDKPESKNEEKEKEKEKKKKKKKVFKPVLSTEARRKALRLRQNGNPFSDAAMKRVFKAAQVRQSTRKQRVACTEMLLRLLHGSFAKAFESTRARKRRTLKAKDVTGAP